MNKIKLLILTVLVSAGVAVAQNVTTPYSMYGYGMLGDKYVYATPDGVGGICDELRTPDQRDEPRFVCFDRFAHLPV